MFEWNNWEQDEKEERKLSLGASWITASLKMFDDRIATFVERTIS